MNNNGGSKVRSIREFLRKWQNVTFVTKGSNSPRSGEDNCHSPEPPPVDVPKGYLAVYVVPELRRFIIPTSYLRDPLFKVLLEKADEEFQFDHSGVPTIPCEIETFKYLLQCMENHRKKAM